MPDHPIVHIEIPAADTQAAGAFYAEVFGWRLQTNVMHDYLQFEAGSGPAGGFVKTSDESDTGNMQYKPGELLVYIATDDIDGALAKVEALGGKIVVPRTEIPQVGWFGVFTDLTGNRVGLFSGNGQ